ncbi:MAG: preprotein translocase subunit YajC [Pseudomonadota bacterium]
MLFTPAYAQSAGGAPPGQGSILELLIPFALIFVIMYFLIIRPQQRRVKEHQEMIAALRRGDEVVTAGGVVAKITKVKEGEDEVEGEIADGVRVRIVKATIGAVLSKTAPADATPPAKTPKAANTDRKGASKK